MNTLNEWIVDPMGNRHPEWQRFIMWFNTIEYVEIMYADSVPLQTPGCSVPWSWVWSAVNKGGWKQMPLDIKDAEEAQAWALATWRMI